MPESDERFRACREAYHRLTRRRGVTPDLARQLMRTDATAIAAVMVHRGEARGLICGKVGRYARHLRVVRDVLAGVDHCPVGALSLLLLEDGPLFVTDTHVHAEPTGPQLARIAMAAAREVGRFGLAPQVALCSGSQFGDADTRSGRVARAALAMRPSPASSTRANAALDARAPVPERPAGPGQRPGLRGLGRDLWARPRAGGRAHDGDGRPRAS